MAATNYIDKTDAFMASVAGEVYRVGGSVRDELLGVRPKDADYMVRGVPLTTLQRRLEAALDNGNWPKPSVMPLKLRSGGQGGWRVSAKGLGAIEIMLPRTDVPREPKSGENLHSAFDVIVDPNLALEEDAARRDFTFNALYKRVGTDEIVDPTGRGLFDLSRRFITTTHPDSFRDDPLRTLRALRFVARGYELSSSARAEMELYAEDVTGLTAGGTSGTVLDELCKILTGTEVATALRTARDTGVLAFVLPELADMIGFDQGSRYHDLTTDEHTFKALATAAMVDAPLEVRMALLFHDAGKPGAHWIGEDGRKHYYAKGANRDHEEVSEDIWRAAAKRLNAPRGLRETVAVLIREHMLPTEGKFKEAKVRKMRARLGDENLRMLIMHRACDISGKGSNINQAALRRLIKWEDVRLKAVADKVPADVRDLQVGGNDWADLGIHGKMIGLVQRAILDEVCSQPDELRLSREWQLEAARRLA